MSTFFEKTIPQKADELSSEDRAWLSKGKDAAAAADRSKRVSPGTAKETTVSPRHRTFSEDKLIDVVSKQGTGGLWAPDTNVTSWLQFKENKVKGLVHAQLPVAALPPGVCKSVCATVFVLAYLGKMCHEARHGWSLLADKAMSAVISSFDKFRHDRLTEEDVAQYVGEWVKRTAANALDVHAFQ